MKILYNPKLGADIKNYWLGQKKWNIPKNSLFRCEDDAIARIFLDTYGFLRDVKPEEISTVKQEMEAKDFICEHCKEAFSTEQKLRGHMLGKHKLSEEHEKMLDGIPMLDPMGTVSLQERTQVTGDVAEGIPEKGKDKDGVEWYGPGVEKDTISPQDTMVRHVIPGKTPGVFGAA